MRLRTYLVILAFVCCLGGLLLAFVIFERQQGLDSSAAQVEIAIERQQDVRRLADHVSNLFIFLDLLFGVSETYMIDGTLTQLKLSKQLLQRLETLPSQSEDTIAFTSRLLVHFKALDQEVGRVLERSGESDFVVSPDQLGSVDGITMALAADLQSLRLSSTALTERARFDQADLRDTFDLATWLAGTVYVFVVVLVLLWVARSVARPLNSVANAADVALRDRLPFEAPVDGPLEVRSLAGQISTLVSSLERAVEGRTQFLTSMSHELRTPLNGVLGMTALLLDSDLRTQDRKCMEVIQSSGESLLSIINELLDFSRFEDGSIELESNEFSLEQLVRKVLDVTMPLAHKKQVALYLEMPLFEHDSFAGDKNRLRQVLLNLVSNAIKFTEEGSVTLKVGLDETVVGVGGLEFCIADTGIGVPADKLQSIFKPFSQSDASITRQYGGSGLGLAICTEISGLMDGTISVSSKVGEGSEFSFSVRLPVVEKLVSGHSYESSAQEVGLVFFDAIKAKNVESNLKALGIKVSRFESMHDFDLPGPSAVMLVDVSSTNAIFINEYAAANPKVHVYAMGYSGLLLDIDEEFVQAVSDPVGPRELFRTLTSDGKITVTATDHTEHQLKVLLADDNPVNLIVASKMIQRLGPVVHQVKNGQEALDACVSEHYDLVFMDLQMPKMDGLSATRKIRAQAMHQPIIIAMTANAAAEDQQACFDAGMDDFVAKPIRLAELDSLLQKYSRDAEHLAPA